MTRENMTKKKNGREMLRQIILERSQKLLIWSGISTQMKALLIHYSL